MALCHHRRDWLGFIVKNSRKMPGDSECSRDKLAVGPRLAVDDQGSPCRIISCNFKNPTAGLVRAQLSRLIK